MAIIKGTTPTIILNLPDHIPWGDLKLGWMVFSQNGKERFTREVFSVEKARIEVKLTQEETLSLSENSKLRVRWKYLLSDGTCGASNPYETDVLPTEKGDVMSE